MTTFNLPIAPLFQEKLMHYRELAAVLQKERQWIINANVDELWRVSDAKRAIAAEIDAIRVRILQLMTDAGMNHGMIPETFQPSKLISLLPVPLRKELAGTLLSLSMAKEKVRSLSRENKRYIESYLSMLDDLMSVLTGKEADPPIYGAGQQANRAKAPALFHREV